MWWFLGRFGLLSNTVSTDGTTYPSTSTHSCIGENGDRFDVATKCVSKLKGVSTENQLRLYALYKQATIGDCNLPKPLGWDFSGAAKWSAWCECRGVDQAEAKTAYVDIVNQLALEMKDKQELKANAKSQTKSAKSKYSDTSDSEDDSLSEDEDSISSSGGLGGGLGPVMSMPVSETFERCEGEDVTLLDACKEGNVALVSKLLGNGNEGLNVEEVDEHGMTCLHWACDRGNDGVVQALLKFGANLGVCDNEGQAPLHYAAFCGHPSIVSLLLESGADRTLIDKDGQTAVDIADDDEIKRILA
eukprot:CFRG5819T1